jgi:RNA polymerase sigma factor (sigma-70 family)
MSGLMGNTFNNEDEFLLKGCLENNRRSQKLLYRKYFNTMFGICLSFSGDKDGAKDILQDAFVKVFTSLDKYGSKGSLEGWIRRIVTNTAIDYFRSKKGLIFQDEFPDEPEDDEDSFFEGEAITTDMILFYIKQLPDGARVVFNLYAVEGMTHKEISINLGINEGTSKSQYKRARTLLKKWINEYELSRQ